MHRDSRRGFTLIEVVIALTIGALVTMLAHALFQAVGDRGRGVLEARAALDRESNARRWLAATFLSLDVGTDSTSGFEGGPDRVAFNTWLFTPDGWFERRRVALGREEGRLVATTIPDTPITLMDSVTDLQFDYLLELGAGSRWVREWVSPVSAPVAARMRVTRVHGSGNGAETDTLLLLIGERG